MQKMIALSSKAYRTKGLWDKQMSQDKMDRQFIVMNEVKEVIVSLASW